MFGSARSWDWLMWSLDSIASHAEILSRQIQADEVSVQGFGYYASGAAAREWVEYEAGNRGVIVLTACTPCGILARYPCLRTALAPPPPPIDAPRQ